MSYVLLLAAILFEVLGTTAMKLSEGFTRLWPTIGMVAGYVAAFTMLTLALRELELGFAYAVWAGVGTALVALVGIAAFGDAVTATKVGGLALVVAGVVVLNLDTSHT